MEVWLGYYETIRRIAMWAGAGLATNEQWRDFFEFIKSVRILITPPQKKIKNEDFNAHRTSLDLLLFTLDLHTLAGNVTRGPVEGP